MELLQGSSAMEGVAITTNTNTAYEMMKVGRQGEDMEDEQEYEPVRDPPGGPPLAKDVKVTYKIPSPHPPLPARPLPAATPTARNVGEEEAVYEHIPGDN